MFTRMNEAIIPYKMHLNRVSLIKNARSKSPTPNNKIGSFKIPDVQNNVLGIMRRATKKMIGFMATKGSNEIKIFLNPIKAKKHMNSI